MRYRLDPARGVPRDAPGIRVFAMDLHRAFWNAVDKTVGLEHATIVNDPFD